MSFGRKMEGWGWLKIVSHRIVRIGLSVTLCHWMFAGTGRVTVSTDILVATEREAWPRYLVGVHHFSMVITITSSHGNNERCASSPWPLNRIQATQWLGPPSETWLVWILIIFTQERGCICLFLSNWRWAFRNYRWPIHRPSLSIHLRNNFGIWSMSTISWRGLPAVFFNGLITVLCI